MPVIRDYDPNDLASLYAIALATGDNGADASSHFVDRKLLGQVYAAPYAIFEPALALVVEDEQGVAGYCVGALDSRVFEDRLERTWWPGLRQGYPLHPTGAVTLRTSDARIIALIHDPPASPDALVTQYPSHLHINLLPRLRGRGCGRALLAAWRNRARDLRSPGFHLGVSTSNARAIRFYEAMGMTELGSPGATGRGEVRWFGALIRPA